MNRLTIFVGVEVVNTNASEHYCLYRFGDFQKSNFLYQTESRYKFRTVALTRLIKRFGDT